MTALHTVAAAFESAADTINRRIGYNLFDTRRANVDQVITELQSYAADLGAALLTDTLPPVGQHTDITAALNAPERRDAIALIQADYTQVRESNRFCTRLTDRGDGSTRLRVQHCESGIYMACTRTHSWDGKQQLITNVATNLAGKGDISDRACPVDEHRTPPFRHLHVPPWTSWRGLGGLQIWRYTYMGIGTALYLRAHNIFPNARWTAGTVSDPAHGLRESLHRRSPWHWEASRCPVCGQSADNAQLEWAQSSRAQLAAAHPETRGR